ncbi:MAG: argininosuccinate lyase [Candidatus Pacebacteria bacterium]|nr:argininosuccinate lyase [Candidatus Paceibacterota bacterium]
MKESSRTPEVAPASSSQNDADMGVNSLWGGRFKGGPSEIMRQINASIDIDQRLAMQDLAGSTAHCHMLVKQGIISAEDGSQILEGLATIGTEIARGEFVFKIEHEDIHMNIESRLAELIGPVAGRLHTARSRNDQVATDFKLWLREEIDGLNLSIQSLQEQLIILAEAHIDTILPGLTHMQAAQPVTLGHHLLAYVEMLGRDRGRLSDCRARMNENPLGSAALAGTPYPIDRDFTTRALGFDRPTANSLDAVSDRDFALEFLAAATILGLHLSRFAEELIIWVSDNFRYIQLSDRFTTGSSIMPQKRNPDAAELLRARVGRSLAAFTNLVLVVKALPLAYAKDLQEDKEPVFATVDSLNLCLAAATGMVKDMTVNRERLYRAAFTGFITATDLADYLVMELKLPFRQAHRVTGEIVALAESLGVGLTELPLTAMQSIEPKLTEAVYEQLTLESSVAKRNSFGGTAPERVKAATAAARKKYVK